MLNDPADSRTDPDVELRARTVTGSGRQEKVSNALFKFDEIAKRSLNVNK